MASRFETNPTTVSQENILRSNIPLIGTLIIPKMRSEDTEEETYSPAAAYRSAPGSRISLAAPPKDPTATLHKLGLQNIDRLNRRDVSQEPGTRGGMFARLGALGMATAYFPDDRSEDNAKNELADSFDFIPNFYLSLPTPVKGKDIDATKGRIPAYQWPEECKIKDAHLKNIRGAGVLVGVLDTGVDADHGEMSEQTVTFRYVSLHPSSPYWPPRDVRGFDPDGHGTHVCGIIAGKTVGVAPEARLCVASVIESETTRTSLVRVAYGLDWMLRQFSGPGNEHRPAVMNMSLGFPSTLASEEDYQQRLVIIGRLLKTMVQANVLPVVSVGNDGPGKYGYPAAFEDALAVGAVDMNLNIASFSGSTPLDISPKKPDIYGYGVDVYSSVERDYEGRASYQNMSGTSMAAPYVTGIAALTLCRAPGLTAKELRRALTENAVSVPAGQGVGLAAFAPGGSLAMSAVPPQDQVNQVASSTLPNEKTSNTHPKGRRSKKAA